MTVSRSPTRTARHSAARRGRSICAERFAARPQNVIKMALPGLTTGDMYVVDLSDGSAPTLVESLRGEHVLEMSGSFAKTALLTGRGVAKKASTGSSEAEAYAELSGLDGMLAQVAFGAKHTVALTHTGEVYTLGSGECGQLGHGNTSSCDQPKLVQTLANRAVAQVACGKAHTLALTAEGDIYSWGAADDGQLGIGRTSPSFVPRYLSALQGTPIAMIASGAAHCAALSVYGRVFTWGEALCGQLGLGTPLRSQASPCEVPDLPDLQAIACGEFHTVVLSAEGSVYSWGLSTRGPPTSRKMTPKPELLTTLTEPITSLSCGGGSTLLIGESGDVLCWPGAGREMGVVPLAPGLKASRTACAGVGALIFVETSITHITPSCAPLAGGSLMELHGAGFYESDGIVLRLTHASGQQKLVRGKLGTDRNGGLIVTAEAPSFSESGPGDVSVAVSFEEGEGETFTTTPVMMRVYSPPSLAKAFPLLRARRSTIQGPPQSERAMDVLRGARREGLLLRSFGRGLCVCARDVFARGERHGHRDAIVRGGRARCDRPHRIGRPVGRARFAAILLTCTD